MADLTSCYFCGAVENVEEYPAIPEQFSPPADVQRTVAICPTCREKLGQVIEPIVAYLDGLDAAGVDGSVEADRGTDAAVEASAGVSDGDATGDADPGDRGADPDGADDDGGGQRIYTRSRPVGYRWEDEFEEDDPGASDDGDDATDDSTPERKYTESRGAGFRFESGGNDGPAEHADGVLRLLLNREFPIDRAVAESVASTAYDLDPGESRATIDALIERGDLVEFDDQLGKPDDAG